MTETIQSKPNTVESDLNPPKESKKKKIAEKAEEKYHDLKNKAAEAGHRYSEKLSDTAATAKKESTRAARLVADRTQDAGTAVYETISDNLFPAILTGIGAAWLTANIIRSRTSSGDQTWTPSETASRIKGTARDMTRRAKAESHHGKEKIKQVAHSNPLYIAGALTVMGALIGLALPRTLRENQFYEEVQHGLKEGGQTEDLG